MNIERLLDIETALIERRFLFLVIHLLQLASLLRLNVMTLAVRTLLFHPVSCFLLK